jgi:hypothetical protein
VLRQENGDTTRIARAILNGMPKRVGKKKNPAAVALAKLGARKGGLAASKKLTAEQRRRSFLALLPWDSR